MTSRGLFLLGLSIELLSAVFLLAAFGAAALAGTDAAALTLDAACWMAVAGAVLAVVGNAIGRRGC